MSIYYIEATVNGTPTVYSFDSTESVSYTLNSEISSHPIEDSADVSDNIKLKNRTVNMSGILTDVKSLNVGSNLSTIDYLQGIEDLYNNKQLFTVYYGKQLTPLTNCFFESVTVSQDNGFGTITFGDKVVSSFKISFSIKQLRFTSRAKIVKVRASEIKDSTQDETNISGAKTFEDKLRSAQTNAASGAEIFTNGYNFVRQ